MVHIKLSEHLIHPWSVISDTFYLRGFFWYENAYYEACLPEEANRIASELDFRRFVEKLNGNYALICKRDEAVYVAADRICSYPLFYGKREDDVMISDRAAWITRDMQLGGGDTEAQLELLAAQMVIGGKTLFSGVLQVQGGQYLVMNHQSGAVSVTDYYTHQHTERLPDDIGFLKAEFRSVTQDVFSRVLRYVDGRKIVLFLSGGYDSRLVATSLNRLGYKNVLCIAFGKESDLEVKASKDVASKLGFEWRLLPYEKNWLLDRLQDEKLLQYWENASNAQVVPYIQGIILEASIASGAIPKDCVVISGNSGDVVEGNQFCGGFVPEGNYSADDLADEILKKHFYAFGGERLAKRPQFRETIKAALSLKTDGIYSYEQAQDLYERFNWRERQCKYVVNDIRSYDEYLGVDWLLPLWDKAFVDYWLGVPTALRANRNLYYRLVEDEEFLTANIETPYLKTLKQSKKYLPLVVRALYPVKKLLGYLRRDSQFYTVTLQEFCRILLFTKGFRASLLSAQIYFTCNTVYQKLYGNVFRFIKDNA